MHVAKFFDERKITGHGANLVAYARRAKPASVVCMVSRCPCLPQRARNRQPVHARGRRHCRGRGTAVPLAECNDATLAQRRCQRPARRIAGAVGGPGHAHGAAPIDGGSAASPDRRVRLDAGAVDPQPALSATRNTHQESAAMNIPQQMHYVEAREPGGPEVLTLTIGAVPVPKPNELLIRVFAAGVNRPDIIQRKGVYPPPPDASPVLGLEVGGEVVAVGASADGFACGDRVCALTNGGSYAEY